MGGMNAIVGFGRRFGRTYWDLNERAWLWLRRFDALLMAIAIGGATAMWIIGAETGNFPLMMAPSVIALAYWLAVILDGS